MVRKLVLLGAALLAFGLPAGTAAAQDTTTFASLPQGSLINAQVTMISKLLLEHTDLKVRVVPMNGADATLRSTNGGESDLTLSDVTLTSAALKGEEAFKGHPISDVRAVAKLLTFTVGIVVPKDSPIKTVQELKGKRMPTGWNAFPQGRALLKALLATGGLTVADVKGVPTPGLIRAAEDLKSGKVEASFYAPAAPKLKEVDAAIGIRFVDVGDTPKSLQAVKSVREDFYLAKLTPRRGLTGIVAPTTMLAFDLAVVSSTHASDAAVYKVAKALYESGNGLKKMSPTFATFDPQKMVKQFSVLKYHPGAIKFYKEQGLWPKS